MKKTFRAYRKFYQELQEALLKPSQKRIYRPQSFKNVAEKTVHKR